MGHIGNTVQTAFTSFDKQTITGSGSTTYTLTHSVANEREIEVFVNNVRQEPSVAYNVSGNQITFTENIASTDTVYVNFQGKALQTVAPPDGSVTTAKIADGSVTTAKIADDAVTSAKINDVTAKQATENTPMFKVYKSANQSISTTTWTKVTFDSEFAGGDPLNEFDTTNSRYQPLVAGWYHIIFNPSFQGNGGSIRYAAIMKNTSYMIYAELVSSTAVRTTVSGLIYLNGTSDYVEFRMYTQGTSSLAIRGGSNETQAQGFLVRAD